MIPPGGMISPALEAAVNRFLRNRFKWFRARREVLSSIDSETIFPCLIAKRFGGERKPKQAAFLQSRKGNVFPGHLNFNADSAISPSITEMIQNRMMIFDSGMPFIS